MVGFFALATAAQAQQAPAEYNFRVTPATVVVIGKALGQMPYSEVSAIIADLQRQMAEQQKPPPPAEVK